MRKLLFVVLAMIIAHAMSWAVIVGIIKLITMCFSIGFSLPVATGIWLILYLLNLVFYKSDGRR